MDYLPLYHRLANAPVLVVGGGDVAARKVRLLCEAGARVHVVALQTGAELARLLEERGEERDVTVERRAYRPADVEGYRLVVSATDDEAVDRQVFQDCIAAGVLVNSVDRPALSNVIFPAVVDRSPVLVAVSTGGASPTLARLVRGWLEARLPTRLGALAEFARARRGEIRERLAGADRRQRFWERLLSGPVAERVYQGEMDTAEEGFRRELARAGDDDAAGWVALVGAGPGDPELLTLKALRLLQSADLILYDNLVNRRILGYARRDATLTYVGKKWRFPSTRQESIHRLMVEAARSGRRVVRLKGGDPFVFGRGGEEMEALASAGIEVLVVPGITAASGSASYAGIPLTHRDASQSVRFVTGHRAENRINLDWPELAKPGQTVVLYMGLPGIEEILAGLIRHGRDPQTPAALVEKATLPEQRVVTGTLEDLARKVRAAGIRGPTTIIVGEVVAHRVGGHPSRQAGPPEERS